MSVTPERKSELIATHARTQGDTGSAPTTWPALA